MSVLHHGYRDGEQPRYERCECGQRVRTDRLDLLAEHAATCTSREPAPPDRREAA